jgi:hypothetical protein
MVSVTKLIDILNKPALINWANKLGLTGVSLKDYQIKSKNKGINKHNEVEEYFKSGKLFNGSDKLISNLKGYEVIGCEVNIDNGYICGRVDIILKKDDEIYICDFKSTNSIYLSTKLQLSTYKHIYNADKIAFINLDNFEIKEINIDTNKYYELVKRLYQINNIITQLNERL